MPSLYGEAVPTEVPLIAMVALTPAVAAVLVVGHPAPLLVLTIVGAVFEWSVTAKTELEVVLVRVVCEGLLRAA